MLGRRDSEEEKHRVSSSTPAADFLPRPTRPPALRRSARSESFKALLLRRGSRSDSSSRISAVERLRMVAAPAADTDLQCAPPPPSERPHAEPASSSQTLSTLDEAHLTRDVTVGPADPNVSLMIEWRQRDTLHHQLLYTSTSPVFFLSSSMRPRSVTPTGRRSAARCRLFTAPMTAIFEREGEEEEDVFIESPVTEGEYKPTLVEAS